MKCALRIRNGQSLNRLPGLLGGYSFYVPKPPTYLTRAQHPPSRARAQTGSSGGNATAGRERNASLLRIHHTPRAGRPAVPAVAYQGVSCRSLPIHGTSFATKVATSYFCILQSDLFAMVCSFVQGKIVFVLMQDLEGHGSRGNVVANSYRFLLLRLTSSAMLNLTKCRSLVLLTSTCLQGGLQAYFPPCSKLHIVPNRPPCKACQWCLQRYHVVKCPNTLPVNGNQGNNSPCVLCSLRTLPSTRTVNKGQISLFPQPGARGVGVATTHGITVEAAPLFVPEKSSLASNPPSYFWAYQIRMYMPADCSARSSKVPLLSFVMSSCLHTNSPSTVASSSRGTG
jgi:hypothetical protein